MKKTDLLGKSAKMLGGMVLACGMLMSSSMAKGNYPSKPINIVVGFGIGGSVLIECHVLCLLFFLIHLMKELKL